MKNQLIGHERMQQSTYTEVDHSVWNKLFIQQKPIIEKFACKEYLDRFKFLELNMEQVIDLNLLNQRMHEYCGWTFKPVIGLLPANEFYLFIREKKFPVSVDMRKPEELQFSALPDIFHDIVGHGPMLLSKKFTSFIDIYSEVAIKYIDSESVASALSNLYWYTFETGLIQEDNLLKFYGGAVITSSKEKDNIFDNSSFKHSFNLESILLSNYNPLEIQKEYYVIESFEALLDATKKLDQVIQEMFF